MEVYTPNPNTNNDLRRRTLLKTISNLSPLRKSMNASLNSSFLEVSNNNDDDERANRRSQHEIHKRLSGLPSEHHKLSESYIKEQFIICTHLFTENKITSKNAWSLQIIDMLKPLCLKVDKETLQVASTSIDISAKVYGIRVDDVHSEGLKLATSLARVSGRKENEEENESDTGETEEATNAKKKKTKKKPVNYTGPKSTIAQNLKTNTDPLPKLEPIDFTTRVNADTATMENLFTNIFKESCNHFVILDKTKTLFEDRDPNVQMIEKRILLSSLPPLPENIKNISHPFSDFRLDEWDPEEEEKQLEEEKSVLNQIQQVVFGDDGLPIPELDGSIHDIFQNNADDDADLNNEDDDIQSIHEMGAPQLRDGTIARIVDFRAANDTAFTSNDTAFTSEYTYNSIVNTRTGKFIDHIWAGPCHWKLKFLRRSTQKFTGQQRSISTTKEQRQGRKKAQPEMIDFTEEVNIDFSKKVVIKKKAPTVDINKITLPLLDMTCEKMMKNIKELMLKPGVCPIEKTIKRGDDSNNLDYDVAPYNYENPNDSMYCSQTQHNDNSDGNMEAHLDNENEWDEHIIREEQRACNMADNLVDNPEMVPKSYINFALKAKQMDMKKLKGAVWQSLTKNVDAPVDRDTQQRKGKVVPITFSEMYKSLPRFLAEKERKELSCPLAFVALLHLCNEQNLKLIQLSSTKDFSINGPEK